jgi:hypothetical protein
LVHSSCHSFLPFLHTCPLLLSLLPPLYHSCNPLSPSLI